MSCDVLTSAFQNGSITDGLSAWRKNVTGALKGQVSSSSSKSTVTAAQTDLAIDRMCHLLLHHRLDQAIANQALSNVQEPLPRQLLVQVVQDQQRQYLSVVPESVQLQLDVRGLAGYAVERSTIDEWNTTSSGVNMHPRYCTFQESMKPEQKPVSLAYPPHLPHPPHPPAQPDTPPSHPSSSYP
jgi:hypothetical protein